ncbi:MAG: metallophosphoesterase family protein [Clostridia bacterium]|nr:metallophosphoesterase family protein [Clostridia bacterium]
MKKTISVILCAAMLLCVLLPAAIAATPAEEAKLHFNSDGKFKIMQFADIQDDVVLSAASASFIKKTVKSESPDLIVLSGDNIGGYSTQNKTLTKTAINSYMKIFESLGVPVAIVFGNHDDQDNGTTKEWQMEVYNSYSVDISYDEGPDIDGCGTYNVPILSSDGSKVAFNVWMFDSGTYEEGYGYDHVHANQIEWYKNTSNALKEANGGEPVYSIAFQHIIVGEIFDALKEVEPGTEGAIEHGGKYYVLPDGNEGSLGETPCPGGRNEGQFAAFVEQGDVLATVSGHDHVNDFIIPYEGVDIINTPTCGFSSYGNEETRGARVFVIDENDTSKYETYVVRCADLMPQSADSAAVYNLAVFFRKIGAFFEDLWDKIKGVFGA